MEKKKIVVIGSSNVDLLMKMDHLPEKGETVTDAGFMQVYGGKGANQEKLTVSCRIIPGVKKPCN